MKNDIEPEQDTNTDFGGWSHFQEVEDVVASTSNITLPWGVCLSTKRCDVSLWELLPHNMQTVSFAGSPVLPLKSSAKRQITSP